MHWVPFFSLLLVFVTENARAASSILMVTMGNTKSHTVTFSALSKALVAKGHKVTLLSPFPGVAQKAGAEELCPDRLVDYVQESSQNLDSLGRKTRGELPISLWEIFVDLFQMCNTIMTDPQVKKFLSSGRTFDLLILDTTYIACALGLVHHFSAPFMYLNNAGMDSRISSVLGNPVPFAVTPNAGSAFTENMNIFQRIYNAGMHIVSRIINVIFVTVAIQPSLNRFLGPGVPSLLELERNASFLLHNGHSSLTYARAYLPNVADVACLQCRPARPLENKDLERFVSESGPEGAIVVSMGTRAADMPDSLRRVFVAAFAKLQQRVVWKWENVSFPDTLPSNVHLVQWLPQQDLLGHPKVVALVSHGGMFSIIETVYHSKPMVVTPIIYDQDVNAAKAADDGFAIKLELEDLTSDILAAAINRVIKDPKYRQKAEQQSMYIRDQPMTPLMTAVFWTEYILRHRGAPQHMRGVAMRDLGLIQWLYLDVLALFILLGGVMWQTSKAITKFARGGAKKCKLN